MTLTCSKGTLPAIWPKWKGPVNDSNQLETRAQKRINRSCWRVLRLRQQCVSCELHISSTCEEVFAGNRGIRLDANLDKQAVTLSVELDEQGLTC